MKNKSVLSCRFVQHGKLHCIMAMLNKLFKIEFERVGSRKEPVTQANYVALAVPVNFKKKEIYQLTCLNV